MARTDAENKAIFDKVQQLKREGLVDRRAKAAAFRMFRAGELSTAIKKADTQIKKKRSNLTLNALKVGAAIVARKKSQSKNKTRRRRGKR